MFITMGFGKLPTIQIPSGCTVSSTEFIKISFNFDEEEIVSQIMEDRINTSISEEIIEIDINNDNEYFKTNDENISVKII